MQKNLKLDLYSRINSGKHQAITLLPPLTQPQLKNKLITRTESIIQKSLSLWANELNLEIFKLADEPNQQNRFNKIIDIFQQAIFIFISMNKMKYARELCYFQIQTFIELQVKYNDLNILKYAFQPWIYLIRIDRKEGNLYDAFDKIKVLDNENKMSFSRSENLLLIQSLHQSLGSDINLKLDIESQSVIEKIKIYLLTQKYINLIELIEAKNIYIVNSYISLLNEAILIGYVNVGDMDRALTIISYYNKTNRCPILKLRELEIKIKLDKMKPTIGRKFICSQLLSLSIQSNEMTIKQIGFSFFLIGLMREVGLYQDAICLTYHCLNSAVKLHDEVLIADSLVTLFSLPQSYEERKKIENLMIKHYYSTQYEFSRRKMLNIFPDLKFVERNDKHYEITVLYENLLSLNINF